MIDGKAIAEKMIAELKALPVPEKKLAAILVGDNKYSKSFLRQKAATAKELGVHFELHEFADTLSQKEVEEAVRKISKDPAVGGVIVQIPLPAHYNRTSVLANIDIEKDVDDLSGGTQPILPPAPASLKRILREINFDLKGKRAVVIGPGFLIGKPIATWLMGKVANLTVIDIGGFDEKALKAADLIVSAAGVPGMIKGKFIKKDAVLIDYSYGTDAKGNISGDVEVATCAKKTNMITQTPGGTGPIVVAQLFVNFYHLAK